MNFTFETVAMEDLLDAAVQCGIHQSKLVCGLQESEWKHISGCLLMKDGVREEQ